MKYLIRFLFAQTLLLASSGSLFSQTLSPEVIATSGTYFFNANNEVSWTIGETVTTTESNAANIVNQGFHQTDIMINAIGEENPFGISVYPNPVESQFTIEVTGTSQPLDFRLVDMKGVILMGGQIDPTMPRRKVSVEQISLGNYLLQVTNPVSKLSKSFKIQKVR